MERLQQLAREMNRRRSMHELAQADTLQDRLQANVQAYREIQDQPQRIDSDALEQTIDQTQQLLDELAEHLSPDMADQIRRQCEKLGQATTGAERSGMAEGIRQVTRATLRITRQRPPGAGDDT